MDIFTQERFSGKVSRRTKKLFLDLAKYTPFLRACYETCGTQTPITLQGWLLQKVVGFNRHAYWQTHFTSQIGDFRNIYVGIESSPGIMPGCYIQGEGKTYIGDYTQIAANVGIITANHDLYDNRIHGQVQEVRIGAYCWIGMNSVILPGVVLGDFTVVGAGAVVSKPFPGGYCVIAGNPAKKIRDLDPEKCVRHKSQYEYNGYIKHEKFEEFRRRYLSV